MLEAANNGAAGKAPVRIEDGELIVPGYDARDRPGSALDLEKQISARLPRVELSDLLVEVDQWTGFCRHLEHAGSESSPAVHSPDLLQHLHASLLAQGCNMSLAEIAQSADLTYDRLVYATGWYVREQTLKRAVTELVNFQYRQPLAACWGGGTLSSSDGQRFPVSGKVRNAAALPRYFGYGKGITFYTWTSDQYSQYGTKVISATVRDATYVLDEILDNETELLILEHATDTAGYTDILFCLFDVLGMRFSPRIRDLGDQRLWRLAGVEIPSRIEFRFKGKINTGLIQERWDDLLRVAGSLKLGYVTASLLMSKLQSYRRQNALTRVLQEYGRLVKTVFILRYLESEPYRRRIGAQLNKGEQLHQLRRFLFFGGDRKIRRRHEEGQNNQAGCLNLLTNAVVLWNTVYMQAAIEALRKEGYPVQQADLVYLSPARTAHINRYGKYRFDVGEAQGRVGLRELRSQPVSPR